MFKKIFRKLFPKSKIDFPSGFMPNRFFMDKVKGAPILLIGEFHNRDYPLYKEKFKDVHVLDIVDNGYVSENFIQQSITDKTPYPDGFFKHVAVIAVLEYIWEDVKALREIRRILSDDGELFLAVHLSKKSIDNGLHCHMYTPGSLKRLLSYVGFEPKSFTINGLCAAIPNTAVALCAVLMLPFWGNESLRKVNQLILRLQNRVGKFEKLNLLVPHPYCYVVAKKSEPEDWISGQIKYYKKNHVQKII